MEALCNLVFVLACRAGFLGTLVAVKLDLSE